MNRTTEQCRDVPNRITVLVCIVFSMLAGAPAAHAQLVSPFRSYNGPSLTKDDWNAASAASKRLLEQDGAAVGKTETWTGPKTGNTGSLTVQNAFKRSGRSCRVVAWRVVYKKTQASREFKLNACQTETGQWKMAD